MEALKGLYHADKLDEQTFIDNFTIRLKEYRQIMANLQQQNKKPLQHYLITGKRGMGKSTLLRRIYIEAKKSPLNKKLHAVRLGAEQYRLSRLFKLWEQVIESLSNDEPELMQQKKDAESSKQYEERLVHIISDYLTKTDKTLLLLIDNFDQFIEKIPDKDKHQLREILMIYPVQIIGNTVFYNENFKSYNNPFFDFFKPIHLANLDKAEAEDFIRQRAIGEGIENYNEIFKNQKGKINTLRILSGGVPRTLLILLSIVSKKNTGDAVDYLHEMIEQVTPLYQDRMKSLSAQQQEIMHHLAMHWDRTPVKEIATEMRIPSKSISAQLVQLEKSGYIKKEDIPGRNHFYEIDERFFNIWLLMSEAAPYDAKRVIWLTKWLDAFYSNEEINDFANFCKNNLKQVKATNRFFITQALIESEKLDERNKKLLVNETMEDLKDKLTEVKIWADEYNKKLSEKEAILKKEIVYLVNKEEFNKALEKLGFLEKINEPDAFNGKGNVYIRTGDIKSAEKYYLMAIEKGNDIAMTNLGNLYKNEKKDINNAEKYYLMAAKRGNDIAMTNLGNLYKNEKKDINNAEKYYLMAVEKGNDKAMNNLGNLYKNEKRDIDSAEKYYLMAIEKGNGTAMFNLGYLFQNEKKDINNAEKYYLMAVEKGNSTAMFNLGYLFQNEKKDIDSAQKYYLMAADNGDDKAMNNLGYLYEKEKKNIIEAEKYYRMAAEKENYIAMTNLGHLYENEKKDIVEAEKYYKMAMAKGDTDAMINLGHLYENEKKDIVEAEKYYIMALEKGNTRSMFALGYLYQNEKKDTARAEKYYLMAIENGSDGAMNNLGNLYENEKKDLAGAEKYYLMAADKGNPEAMGNLANLYFETNNSQQKLKALELSTQAVQLTKFNDIGLLDFHSGILLWNEKLKEAYVQMTSIIEGSLNCDENMVYISEALQYFLVFRQKRFLFKMFNTNKELIDRYKPVYYALMHEMQDEYPKEFLKMTEELQEPVTAILEFVKKERERLGI